MVYTDSVNYVQTFADQVRLALGNRVLQMILFGSRARQDHFEYSDYDIAMVVDQYTNEMQDKILDIEVEMLNKHDVLFSTILYNSKEWELEKNTPLGWNIQDEGLNL